MHDTEPNAQNGAPGLQKDTSTLADTIRKLREQARRGDEAASAEITSILDALAPPQRTYVRGDRVVTVRDLTHDYRGPIGMPIARGTAGTVEHVDLGSVVVWFEGWSSGVRLNPEVLDPAPPPPKPPHEFKVHEVVRVKPDVADTGSAGHGQTFLAGFAGQEGVVVLVPSSRGIDEPRLHVTFDSRVDPVVIRASLVEPCLGTRQVEVKFGGDVLRVRDDGYRFKFQLRTPGIGNVDPSEWVHWASYKHCDLPGPAATLADFLMGSLRRLDPTWLGQRMDALARALAACGIRLPLTAHTLIVDAMREVPSCP